MHSLRAFLLVSLVCFPNGVSGQQPKSKFIIERECDITFGGGGYPRLDLDLGSLPLESTGRVTLHAFNTSDQTVELGRYFSADTLIKTTDSPMSVPAQSSADIVFELTTPRKSKSADQVVRFIIAPNEQQMSRGLQVTLKYRISGLVAFKDGMIVETAAAGSKKLQFTVPLLVEEPARYEDISFQALGALKDLSLELRHSPGSPLLQCEIETRLLGPAGLTGELEIVDSKSGMRDRLLCTLIATPVVTVAPYPLRLKWSQVNKHFTSTAILQHNSAAASESSGNIARLASEKDVKICASLDGVQCELSTTKLTTGLYKVSLKVKPELPMEEFVTKEFPDGILWIVTAGGRDHAYKSAVSFR